MVEARAGEIDKPTNEIMEWAKWAHKQADKIDPIVNFCGIIDAHKELV